MAQVRTSLAAEVPSVDEPMAIALLGPGVLWDGNPAMAATLNAPASMMLRGRHVTSWPSLQTDVRNAGATWTDEQVVVDRGLVTSRKPDDIPAFNRKMIEEFVEGAPASRTARSTVET